MANNNIWLQINGETMPTPRTYSATFSVFDSSDSERNNAGYLNRTVIRKGQTAVDFGFRLKTEALKKLLEKTDPDKLNITYYDPRTMPLNSFVGYRGATVKTKLVLQKDDMKDCLWDVDLSFIEY